MSPSETALERLEKCASRGWPATLRRDQCAEIARRRRYFLEELLMPEATWKRIERAFMARRGARLSVEEVQALRLWGTV